MYQRRLVIGVFLYLSLLASSMVAMAADGFDLFNQLISDNRIIKMPFRQSTYDSDGKVGDDITGTLWVQQPNRFRLQYDNPARPLIVSSGEQVWFYEADIQQVVIRPLHSIDQGGLLSLLSGGGLDALRDRYIFTSSTGDDIIWLNAETLDETDSVRYVRFGFSADSDELHQVHITDAFDGRVLLNISDISHQATEEGLFSFIPPAGVDILTVDE